MTIEIPPSMGRASIPQAEAHICTKYMVNLTVTVSKPVDYNLAAFVGLGLFIYFVECT